MNWREWPKGANASIYSCHLLASWSGRMWAFSMGLFLISLSPGTLQLSAIYGLSMGAAILVLGSIIGDWVDKTPRLKAATVSMIFQNVLIATCACVVFILIMLVSELGDVVDWLRHLFYAIIITLSVCSRLMKEARIFVVERDWIVEICAKEEHQLAVMTSTFRRLDLLTKILAPIVTGQILTYAGIKIGCGFIAFWSLISLIIEYYLIRRVYSIVPALKATKREVVYLTNYNLTVDVVTEEAAFLETPNMRADYKKRDQPQPIKTSAGKSQVMIALRKLLLSFLSLYRGLHIYFGSVTKWPGLALAFLYMTVLGFDDITVGYATTQGLSGSILGILMGVGAVFGILATFTYPCIVRKLGLPLTGVLALGLQVTCLTLCVISLWLPGSVFDLHPNQKIEETDGNSTNCSASMHNRTLNSVEFGSGSRQILINTTSCLDEVQQSGKDYNISVMVLIAGIVLARFGLWTADLTTIQMFLKNVPPSQRGIVNGFQSSLNQLMDFFKYGLVLIMPHPHQFGLLVFISYAFVCTGWMFMVVTAVQAVKKRTTMSDGRTNNEITLEIHDK